MTAKIQQGLDAVWSCFAMLFFLGLLIWQSAQAEIRGPIKVRTDNGTFIFPREFAAADIWKTLKIKPFETNYFLFRLPSTYAEKNIQGFAAIENYFEQHVVVTVEVLTKKRQVELQDIDSSRCRQASHDLYPQSVPYKRCEYRKHLSSDGIAIKYHLNGENNQYYREVEALIQKKLNEWKVS